MKNKSEKLLNRYLELDKNQKVPFDLTIQLLFNRKCRQQIKMLSMAEKALSAPLEVQAPVTDSAIEQIMNKIDLKKYKKNCSKSPKKALWIAIGIVLIAIISSSLYFLGKIKNDFYLLLFSCNLHYALHSFICIQQY